MKSNVRGSRMDRTVSHVCSCGMGYRSQHDLKCGYCRDEAALAAYFKALEDAKREIQLQHFGVYVYPVQIHKQITFYKD